MADASVATIPLASTTNLATDTAVVATIDRVDANGTATSSLEETVIGVVSGSNLVTSTRGAEGTAQAHAAGAVVEILVTAKGWNDMIDMLLVQHNQLGYHTNLTACNITASGTTTASHISASDVAMRVLNDVNANELLKFTATASAVNEVTVTNAATGNNPIVSMTGGDAAVGLDFKMKSTGKFRRPTIVELPVGSASASLATGDGQAFFRVPDELNGMNLTGIAAVVYTAGTTNTLDVQIRNHTDTADMLSTKITIDSTEKDTLTAATPAVINAATDDVVTGDVIAVDIDAVHTTPAKGLIVQLRFELP